jgi:hypothetical protein
VRGSRGQPGRRPEAAKERTRGLFCEVQRAPLWGFELFGLSARARTRRCDLNSRAPYKLQLGAVIEMAGICIC